MNEVEAEGTRKVVRRRDETMKVGTGDLEKKKTIGPILSVRNENFDRSTIDNAKLITFQQEHPRPHCNG